MALRLTSEGTVTDSEELESNFLPNTWHLDDQGFAYGLRNHFNARKYSPDGELLWEFNYGSPMGPYIGGSRGSVVDEAGQVYMFGVYCAYGDSCDLHLVKLSSAGALSGAWTYQDDLNPLAEPVVNMSANDLVFGPGQTLFLGGTNQANGFGHLSWVIASVNTSGQLQDQVWFEGTDEPILHRLAYDSIHQKLYATGTDGPNIVTQQYSYTATTSARPAFQPGSLTVQAQPNPASAGVQFTLPEPCPSSRLAVFDPTCKQVADRIFSGATTGLDVAAWPPGIYFYRITNRNGWSCGRLVVER